MCIWNIHTLFLSLCVDFCILRWAVSCLFVEACVWYLLSGRCVRGWHGGITQTSIPLDSCSLPSDASHLRHRHRRPSKPSVCLSLLIDLSLDGGVWECFGENMYFDRSSAQECVPYIRRGGQWLGDVFSALRWISYFSDVLFKQSGRELYGEVSPQFYSRNLVCFSCSSEYIKLNWTSLLPSGSSLTNPALPTVFWDSCLNARKHYHSRRCPPCLHAIAEYSFENGFLSSGLNSRSVEINKSIKYFFCLLSQ